MDIAEASPKAPRVLINPADCSVVDPGQHAILWRWSWRAGTLEHHGGACVSALVAGGATELKAGTGSHAVVDKGGLLFLREGERYDLELRTKLPFCAITVLFRQSG